MGEYVFHQDDKGDSFYVIVEGSAQATPTRTPDSNP